MVDRVLGENVGISIPTAIPFEEAIMKEDVKTKTDAIFINVRTLFRNLFTSYEKDGRPNVREMIPPLIEEIEMIKGLLRSADLKYLLYWPSYHGLKRAMPGAKFKEIASENQKFFNASERLAGQALSKVKDLEILQVDYKLPPFEGRVWMITHFPVDLLNRYKYNSLSLLESHSGAVKDPMAWNSKLSKNSDYVRIPFNAMSFQVFGSGHVDSSVQAKEMLTGFGVKYRRVLKEASVTDRWSPMTTKDRIVSSLKKHSEKEIAKELIQLFNVKI